MLLQEALKSETPFKLPEMNDFLYVKKHPDTKIDYCYWLADDVLCGIFPVYSLLSDRWTLMEVPDNVIKFRSKEV